MKYDERACKFNMDTGCVELLLRDGRKVSIDCTGVEDALDVTMAQRSELDYLIYNDPLSYADLILNGDPEEYLKNVTGSHWLEDQRQNKNRGRPEGRTLQKSTHDKEGKEFHQKNTLPSFYFSLKLSDGENHDLGS